MKRIVNLVLLIAMLLVGTSAMADTSDIKHFAEHTDIDLDVFINNGYSCYYDDFEFSAEIAPANNVIEYHGYDDYSIKMDIKVLYSAGSCMFIPRLIFERAITSTYFDDRMSKVYIRNGDNRYIIDVSGCSRSTSSKYSTVTYKSVEPIRIGGRIMLEDLALYPQTIDVKMGSYGDVFTLTDADKELINNFYTDCLEAGIFSQDCMIDTDDYYIRTLFNENSVVASEDEAVEEVPSDGEQ
ncbi:MAG: hypothetical protein ACLTAO_01760 [Christensenellales bacterium]